MRRLATYLQAKMIWPTAPETERTGRKPRGKTMNTKIRQAFALVAFSAVAAAAITGATLRGESKETSLTTACAAYDWPKIPAACLDGARTADVRYVSADAAAAGAALRPSYN